MEPIKLEPLAEMANRVIKAANLAEEQRLSNFIPYDLSEIDIIAKKAEKICNKSKTTNTKIRHLMLALEKIDLRINNSILAYRDLEKEGEISDPEIFDGHLEQAKSIRKRLEIAVHEYQLQNTRRTSGFRSSPSQRSSFSGCL
jgi:hypothetical protein